jgi:hypothetical protein
MRKTAEERVIRCGVQHLIGHMPPVLNHDVTPLRHILAPSSGQGVKLRISVEMKRA